MPQNDNTKSLDLDPNWRSRYLAQPLTLRVLAIFTLKCVNLIPFSHLDQLGIFTEMHTQFASSLSDFVPTSSCYVKK